MYERFTDRARKVMTLANQEAQRCGHEAMTTLHVLLGLVKEGSGVAATVLKNLDVDLRKVRDAARELCPERDTDSGVYVKLPQTVEVQQVANRAIEAARDLNHNYVGTEHMLLGLLAVGGAHMRVLSKFELDADTVREEILTLLWATKEMPLSATWPEPSVRMKEAAVARAVKGDETVAPSSDPSTKNCFGCGCELSDGQGSHFNGNELWCNKECFDKYSPSLLPHGAQTAAVVKALETAVVVDGMQYSADRRPNAHPQCAPEFCALGTHEECPKVFTANFGGDDDKYKARVASNVQAVVRLRDFCTMHRLTHRIQHNVPGHNKWLVQAYWLGDHWGMQAEASELRDSVDAVISKCGEMLVAEQQRTHDGTPAEIDEPRGVMRHDRMMKDARDIKSFVLPGKYSIYEKVGNYERYVSFQTLEELNAYMAREKP